MAQQRVEPALFDDEGDAGFIPVDYLPPPEIAAIDPRDVMACLRRGLSDFERSKGYGLFFGGFYTVCGLGFLAALLLTGREYLAFPAIAGFLLVGPITAVGLYEISRRLEAAEPLDARAILLAFTRHGGMQLLLFGAVLVFLMIVWMKAAALVYAFSFGLDPVAIRDLPGLALSSPRVALFLLAGNLVGGALALAAFSISVVAVPYLLHRDVDFITAMVTSLRCVRHNPKAMAVFAAIIAGLVALSVLTGLVGLLIVLPTIGHATWHLYRKLVRGASDSPV